MLKQELLHIWKQYWLSDKDIESIILKETSLSSSQFFLVKEIEEKYIQNVKSKFEAFDNWESIEYIINNTDFYWLNFYVDNRVLIPRDDTEILVTWAINIIKSHNISNFIDIWTGSWIIPISIANNTNSLTNIVAVDLEKNALDVAQINIDTHSLTSKIKLIQSDLLENVPDINWDLVITANLPYIKDGDHEHMDTKTIKNEPDSALYWWEETWFELYEILIDQTQELKEINNIKNIFLFIEIWFDQYKYSKNYLEDLWLKHEYFKDNWWVFRCVRVDI